VLVWFEQIVHPARNRANFNCAKIRGDPFGAVHRNNGDGLACAHVKFFQRVADLIHFVGHLLERELTFRREQRGFVRALGEIAFASFGAGLPEGMENGLEAVAYYDPSNFVWPFGTHIAVVEVDAETGAVDLQRYIAVDDCGNIINPMIVDGQIHGGIAQGLAQALYEEVVYGDDGNLLTGNLTTYMVPTAPDLPSFTLDRTITPSPVNPLGVKGVGESATIGSTPAVVNAVLDALAPLGIAEMDPPCTPEKVWRAIERARTEAKT